MNYGRTTKTIASLLLILLLHEIVLPIWLPLYATTQPESFGSSGSSEYVDPFTGQFKYSIPVITVPGPNGSDYTLDLSYNSGIKPEEEASWVGWGWNLSPGSITRMKNGLPDDIRDVEIQKFNKTEPIQTVSSSLGFGLEFFDSKNFSLGLRDATSYHNSITGWSMGVGLSVRVLFIPLSISINNEGIGFTTGMNWYGLMNQVAGDKTLGKVSERVGTNSLTSTLSMNIPFTNSRITGTNALELSENEDKTYQTSYDLDVHTTGYALGGATFSNGGSESYTTTKEISTFSGSGFLFSGSQKLDGESKGELMDYLYDKEYPFLGGNKKHPHLSMPRHGADMFIATGKGPSGTFRAYHNKPIMFAPRTVISRIPRFRKHFSLIGGASLGAGYGQQLSGKRYNGTTMYHGYVKPPLDVSGCDIPHENPLGGFENPGYCQPDWFKDNPGRYVFRFTNDPGQPLTYTRHSSNVNDGYYPLVNGTGSMSSATMISYRTKEQLKSTNKRRVLAYGSYSSNSTSNTDVGTQKNDDILSSTSNPQSIDEFTTFDNSGTRYVYSLPVFSRNEHNLSYVFSRDFSLPNDTRIYYNNTLDIYKSNGGIKDIDQLPNVSGEKVNAQYANSFLPTQILSADFVDLTNNGPDRDDPGTYVLLSYRKKGFVKWRYPHRGFIYEPARSKTGLYNTATVSYGEREQTYLSTVRTKTHIAYFITNKTQTTVEGTNGQISLAGSGRQRKDAIASPKDETVAGSSGFTVTNDNQKEVLERVEIYSLDNTDKPQTKIKTVYFSYSYELMKGAPDASAETGKLTLKNIWEENLNISEAKIAKYTFEYNYPAMPANTPTTLSYNTLFPTINTNLQNPDFNTEKIDAWGFYQKSDHRYIHHLYWNEQNAGSDFDPAAWHLKRIITPSGGEILAQYEQQDYSYVQDQRSMMMIAVLQQQEEGGIYKYRVKVANTESDRNSIMNYLKRRFVDDREYIYFRFRYTTGFDNFTNRIMDGYTHVTNIKAHDTEPTDIIIEMDNSNWDYAPINVAKDFVRKYGTISSTATPFVPILSWFVGAAANASAALDNVFSCSPEFQLHYKNLQYQGSFLRLPIPISKKGGGTRVKRILTVSPYNSLETNSSNLPVIYGQEYIYKTYDALTNTMISSGVATNEPVQISYENPLVNILPTNSGYYEKQGCAIFGEDKDASEGPIHYGFLPNPTIGYSSVYTKNINTGPSGGGYTLYQYHTAKEYPTVQFEYTNNEISGEMPSVFSAQALSFIEPWNTETENYGYGKYTLRFSAKHGLLKSVGYYAGILNLPEIGQFVGEPIQLTEYKYYEDNEAKPVMYSPSSPIRYENIGQVREFWAENKCILQQHYFKYGDISIALNTTILPPFWGSWNLMIDYSRDMLTIRTSVIAETNTPFIKEITTTSDNMKSVTSFLAFDPNSGVPVLTKTIGNHTGVSGITGNTPFNGSTYQYSLPAYAEYKSFQSKTNNEGLIFVTGLNDALLGENTMSLNGGNLEVTLNAGLDDQGRSLVLKEKLVKDDIIELFTNVNSTSGVLYKIDGDVNKISPSGYSDEVFSCSVSPAISGSSFSGQIKKIIIRKSGYENRTGASEQSIVLYNADDEIKSVFDYAEKLKVRDEAAKILNDRVIFNTPVNNTSVNTYSYEEKLNKEQKFTYYPLYHIGQHDLIYTNDIIYGVNTNNYGVKAYKETNSNILRIGFTYQSNWAPIPGIPGNFPMVDQRTYMKGQQFSLNNDGRIALSAEKYNSDRFYSDVLPRCGKRKSSNDDCYSSNDVDIQSQRKNAFPTNVYAKVLFSEKTLYSKEYTLIPEKLSSNINSPIGAVEKKLMPYQRYILRNTALAGIPGNNYDYGTQTYSSFSTNSDNWQLVSVIESYNELGTPVTIRDITGQYMTTRYGLNGALPLCTGSYARAFREPAYTQNDAYFHDIYFQSFETYSPIVFSGGSLTSSKSHTGSKSLQIPSSSLSTIKHNITPYDFESPARHSYEISFWASSSDITFNGQLSISLGNYNFNSNGIVPEARIMKISNDGTLWFLYKVSGAAIDALFTSNTNLSINNTSSTAILFIDDLKIRPLESNSVCYVYDPLTYQTLSVLDDNHYASMIQYDMRGVAIRTLTETKAGWKTVSEQTSNIYRTMKPTVIGAPLGMNSGPSSNLIVPQGRHEIDNSTVKNMLTTPVNMENTQGVRSGPVDMLQLQLSPDKKKFRVFGVDPDSVSSHSNKSEPNK